LSGASATVPATAAANSWTWVGSNTAGAAGSYGTQGVAAPSNAPGARNGHLGWRDSSGNLWLFGGLGYDSVGNGGNLNDLWKFSPATGQWTWIGGASTANAKGIYGARGVAAATNVPGARESGASRVDAAGNVWLFGGAGYDSTGTAGALNDLWEYSPGTGQWTWVSGALTVNASASYGTRGAAAASNMPGGREAGLSWIDAAGNLWVFGGVGYDSVGGSGDLNDLWEFNPTTGQWTWVSGASTVNALGVYGTRGTAAAGIVPGSRYAVVAWTDTAGNLWLLGGSGFDSVGTNGYLNDLWEFSPASGQWTWVGGSATANAVGVYGTEGTASASNGPGGREAPISWTDAAGNLWCRAVSAST
jgi:N-acetylneuraminic acid mutarotase